MSRRGYTPTSAKEDWKAAFIEALYAAPNVAKAARAAKVDRSHAYVTRREDPAFAAAWDDALASSLDEVEEQLIRRAKDTDTVAAIFMLKSHRPEIYREKVSTEHTGGIDVRITYEDRDIDPVAQAAQRSGGSPLETK